jgi:BASS family bile acid:Na+ symporter
MTTNPSPPGGGVFHRIMLALAALALAALLVGRFAGIQPLVGPAAIVLLGALATFFSGHPKLKTFTFTFWVFTFVAAAMFYPSWFLYYGDYKLTNLIVPLIQIIMFGMGTSLSVGDFLRALRMPKAVGVGIFLQFAVMPLTGWAIASIFGFPPEIAAGVILIGSCSGGVASNVMAYLSRGNVALSVTMTACSTLLAPVLTPTAMQLLAGRLVPINFWQMMVEIIWMVIVPIVGGLLFNWILHGKHAWLDRALPIVSMAAICYIIAIITANARDKLLDVAFALIGAAMLHNAVGYLLGYFGARAAGLSETDCRTVAFEVGMQNGGMGTGLAINVLQSADAALAPNIFGTWMNISGSTLASWWRERPPGDAGTGEAPEAAKPEEMPAVT